MKHILVISAGFLLFGLLPQQGHSQTFNEARDPANTPIYPLSEDAVRPLPKPDNNNRDLYPSPAEPLHMHSGQNPPPNVTRPLEPLPQPSIDRLYQNRMDVDNYSPVIPQTPVLAQPPGSMMPEQAPGRPGTIGGTGGQGGLDNR